jgi:hypothetical protein
MPRRIDEYWAAEKDDSKYCSKHEEWYKKEIGCKSCFDENAKFRDENRTPLLKCPSCGKESMMLNTSEYTYTCLNPECNETFGPSDLLGKKPDTDLENK